MPENAYGLRPAEDNHPHAATISFVTMLANLQRRCEVSCVSAEYRDTRLGIRYPGAPMDHRYRGYVTLCISIEVGNAVERSL